MTALAPALTRRPRHAAPPASGHQLLARAIAALLLLYWIGRLALRLALRLAAALLGAAAIAAFFGLALIVAGTR